jgi:hypothetical protein
MYLDAVRQPRYFLGVRVEMKCAETQVFSTMKIKKMHTISIVGKISFTFTMITCKDQKSENLNLIYYSLGRQMVYQYQTNRETQHHDQSPNQKT